MDHAFYGCKSLKCIKVPSSVRSIGYQAFYDCEELEDVELVEGLSTVGVNAFWNCVSLQYIQLPSTVKAVVGVKLDKEEEGKVDYLALMPRTIPTFIFM